MPNPTHNFDLAVILAACDTERTVAGGTRDGTAMARAGVIVGVLDNLAAHCATPSSLLQVMAAQNEALVTMLYCSIHDRFARGELQGRAYDVALVVLRSQLALRVAQRRAAATDKGAGS